MIMYFSADIATITDAIPLTKQMKHVICPKHLTLLSGKMHKLTLLSIIFCIIREIYIAYFQ